MTTGMGRRRIRRSKNSRPSILGIWTSRVKTSGFRVLINSRAVAASGALPTTSSCGDEFDNFAQQTAHQGRIIDHQYLFFHGRHPAPWPLQPQGSATGPLPSNKQFHIPGHLLGCQPCLVGSLPTEQRIVMDPMQFLQHHPAVIWKIVNLSRVRIEQVLGYDWDFLRLR